MFEPFDDFLRRILPEQFPERQTADEYRFLDRLRDDVPEAFEEDNTTMEEE